MDPLVRLDHVDEDVEIVLFSPRQIAADRQLIENSGGSVEVALGTEVMERELGDQLHVASDPARSASSASVAGGNAHDAVSNVALWANLTIATVFPGAHVVLPVSQHVPNVHAPFDIVPVLVAFVIVNPRSGDIKAIWLRSQNQIDSVDCHAAYRGQERQTIRRNLWHVTSQQHILKSCDCAPNPFVPCTLTLETGMLGLTPQPI